MPCSQDKISVIQGFERGFMSGWDAAKRGDPYPYPKAALTKWMEEEVAGNAVLAAKVRLAK